MHPCDMHTRGDKVNKRIASAAMQPELRVELLQVIVDLPAKVAQGERPSDVDTGLWSPLVQDTPVASAAYTGLELMVDGRALHRPARAKLQAASADALGQATENVGAQCADRKSSQPAASQLVNGQQDVACKHSSFGHETDAGAPYIVGTSALPPSANIQAASSTKARLTAATCRTQSLTAAGLAGIGGSQLHASTAARASATVQSGGACALPALRR